MKRAQAAVLLATLALAGCAGGRNLVAPSGHGVLHSLRADKAAEIGAARASDGGLFSIFPRSPGEKSCTLPAGGMTAMTFPATCRTSVAYPTTHGRYPEAFVTFREHWQSHVSSWTVIVQWPAEKVVGTQLHGAVSPQMRYAATDDLAGQHFLAAAQVQVVAYSSRNVRICPPYAIAVDFGSQQVPACRDGLRAVGVDTSALTSRIKGSAARWGLLHLVGVYREGVFHVISQGKWQVAPNPPSPFESPIPCPAPAGGWRFDDPTEAQRVTLDHYATLAHHHDLVSSAFFHDGSILVVSSVDPVRTRRVLGRAWPRQLCVVQARYSRAFVNRVRARMISVLHAPKAAEYGWPTGGGGTGINARGQLTTELDVLLVTPKLRALLRTLPAGVVDVQATLRRARAQA